MVLPRDETERLSKTVFGQVHRLAIMKAIADSNGRVNPTELAQQLGFASQSALQASLRDLVEAGLLERRPNDGGRTYYDRADSTAWAFAQELADRSGSS